MTWSHVAAWTALAAVLTITPGVDMALVARYALGRGRGPALSATFGIVSGCMTWASASAVGIAAVLAASATAYDVLRFAGAAYLAYLGIGAIRHAGRHADGSGPALRSPFWTGLISNLANPKIVVFYSTVLPGFIPRGTSVLLWSLVFAGIHAVLGVLWLAGYAHLLSRAARVFERPRVRRALDRATGTVLIALGVRLAASSRT